jgi:GH25 family lysozyme M1 (1,4-beta-N-acetylmuramidase)
MRSFVRPWLAAAAAAASFVASLSMAGPAASATWSPPDRSNVGMTHSPQLLRQLAGPPGAVRAAIARSAIPGAEQGVDVASFQHINGPINWRRVARAGIRFAAVKTTEGDYYQNPYALSDLSAARAAGLSVIAYAFAIPNGNGASASPVTQANDLLSYLGASKRKVSIALDIEYNPYGKECYRLSKSAMVKWISSFARRIHYKTRRFPIIYTTPQWWQNCTGGSAALAGVPLWVAYYAAASSPVLPAGWGNWAIWQYTSVGTVPGIKNPGGTDLDQLNPATGFPA